MYIHVYFMNIVYNIIYVLKLVDAIRSKCHMVGY